MNSQAAKTLRLLGSLVVAGGIAWYAWQHGQQEAAITHDFGPVPLNAKRDFNLELSNPDAQPHALRSITPSCTCLQIIAPPSIVPAHGKVTLRIRMTPEKPGPALANVRVEWDAEPVGPPQGLWHFRAQVIPPAEAMPSSEMVTSARTRLTSGLTMSAAAAVADSAPDRVIVDLRPARDYQMATIPGALNLPLAALISLPGDMRVKPLLVLDRGFGSAAVSDVVQRLRATGWKTAHVLEGGLAAWQANGGRVSVAMPSAGRLIGADEARLNATLPGWITVVPQALAASWHTKELFPDSLTYDERDSAADIAKTLSRELMRRRPGDGATTSVLHVLVASESGDHAAAIAEALQPQTPGLPVFILNGGLRGYLDHLRTLQPPAEHRMVTLADYRGVLADLRARQRLVASCSSCSR